MTALERKWQCSRCETIHDDEWEAEECCPTEVWDVFVCPHCDEAHDTEETAIACCPEQDPLSPEAYRNRVAELEAAGQQRLIP